MAQQKTNNSIALHNSAMLSHRLMNLIVINVVSIIKIQEAQVFPSMPVGVWPKTPTKASNPKRQRQRRNNALKKGEQKFVAANDMGAIEKAFGSYNDNLESSTESSESLIEIESELNSSEVESKSQRFCFHHHGGTICQVHRTSKKSYYLDAYAKDNNKVHG